MQIVECPRDAMQGWHSFIPTQDKIKYINELLKVGFHTIDFGSFVSPKAIPQMKDTAEVLAGLDLDNTKSELLAIVANLRGANDAAEHNEIKYLGFPLSLSETFQLRNTNKSIKEAKESLKEIQDVCQRNNKILVTYLSMGFGNPYNDPYNADYLLEFTRELEQIGVSIVSLSDTVGSASPEEIKQAFENTTREFPDITIGAHFHSTPDKALEKISAAYDAGCRRFDSAIRGFGGCPMAKDDLTGNIATETILQYLGKNNIDSGLDNDQFNACIKASASVFV
ncbi:hydroxymethylglutaryl-CoA lyase [Marinigracilibium pacificum]|uniref:Hydroxymethylglutaryl-CoA lyase n=1 Tax=Marinigracilibium pacificum TaxID=2729599 RepID=A0A848J141_9BACT|nr:hydroxymethylglutaryl-CoA lyase [Marinigracilibium pacificum]NMM49235.1 hydroxymethylglutaryl-CoA lyase [Marinigracilibium pacificum]